MRGRKKLTIAVRIARLEAQLVELRKQQESPKVVLESEAVYRAE